MENRKCRTCKNEFPLTEEYFYKRQDRGFTSSLDCKQCVKSRSTQYYQENKEKVLDYSKNYYETNKQKIRKYQSSYRKKRSKEDPGFRLFMSLRSRLINALNGMYKAETTKKLVGCNQDELKQHLESQFTERMTWDNYGRDGWHIDHIIGCKEFDLSNLEEQRKCFNFKNLQPLWADDNLKKRFSK